MGIKHQNRKSIKFCLYWLTILLILLFCTCARQSNILATDKSVEPSAYPTETVTPVGNAEILEKPEVDQRVPHNIDQENPLKTLLAGASWDAINEAKRQGKSALPIIKPFLKDDNYQVRQMAVSSAGAIGDDLASDILSSGLNDSNINVRLAAAKELAKRPYPSATDTVLVVIGNSPDDTVRELLIKSAGFLPGEKTISTLLPIAKSNGSIGDQAIYSLAKLGNSYGLRLISKKLSAAAPRTRYDSLQNLCYVNNLKFVPQAKKLLSDKKDAIRIGSVRKPQMRRVADGAVDSLVCLLNLDLPFVNSSKIYTDDEISKVRALVEIKEK